MADLTGYLNPEEQLIGTKQEEQKLSGELSYALSVDPYVHPQTHPASMIVEDSEHVFLSAAQKTQLLSQKANFVHDQIAAASLWNIEHDLKRYPSVSVADSSGNLVLGDVVYISENRLTISFSAAFSGKAYLN
jgi:hypothetical protein